MPLKNAIDFQFVVLPEASFNLLFIILVEIATAYGLAMTRRRRPLGINSGDGETSNDAGHPPSINLRTDRRVPGLIETEVRRTGGR